MTTAVTPRPAGSRGRPTAAPPGSLVVIKFGGTSLGTAARIRTAARRVRTLVRTGVCPVVVVSAAGQATDRVLRRLEAVGGPAAGRETDRALATGEDLSAALLAAALQGLGLPAVSLRGGEAGIDAEGEFGAGRPVALRPGPLRSLAAAGTVAVVSGFQGGRADGETVTLGRGGSDLTAVFLAARLGAAECLIVTDVDGVYSADPRRDATATWLPSLSHAALVELTGSGAVVVHAGAARLAAEARVPLRVLHHAAPLGRPVGTVIHPDAGGGPR